MADAAQAYLDLLASTEPLTAAHTAPQAPRRPGRIHSHQAPRTPGRLDSHRAPQAPRTPGRFHSHRAPARPIAFGLLGERGRSAVMAAALVAGVGVAGVASATAGTGTTPVKAAAAQARTQTAAHTPIDPASTGGRSATVATPGDEAAAGGRTWAGGSDGAGADMAAAYGAGVTGTGQDAGTASIAAAEAEKDANEVTTGGPAQAFAPVLRKAKPLPVAQWVNPLPEAAVTSCYGPRWGRLHAGVDMAAPDGTPIRAAGAGVVVSAGPAEGYGIAVLIDHGNGYLTHYGHMSEVSVAAGQMVKPGEQIGLEGSTGHSTGPHLHFEVHEGYYKNPIEPTQWMHDHGVDITSCVTFAAEPAE